jgi:hypothetical protein
MANVQHSFTDAVHRDVYRAVQALPRLTLVVAVLIALAMVLEIAAGSFIPTNSLLGHSIPAVLYYALVTPFFIAVHRFIILEEATDGYRLDWRDRRFQVFFGWAFVVFLVSQFPVLMFKLPQHLTTFLLAWAGVIAMWVVFVRSMILFPAIAVDAPGATLRHAFDDTRGHFWTIFLSFLIPFLPSLLIAAMIGGVAVFLMPSWAASGFLVVLVGLVQMLWITMAVVIASRIYLTLGNRLNRVA